MREFLEEFELWARFEHRHVARFIGVCVRPPDLCLISECFVGSLNHVLDHVSFSRRQKVGMARDAAAGLAYLHGAGARSLHRDIACRNLLIDEELRVVLSDFGLSQRIDEAPTSLVVPTRW